MSESFVFILNPINFVDEFPIEIIPGHFFKKPNHAQLEIIKQLLVRLHPVSLGLFPYEYLIVENEQDNKGSVAIERKELPQDKWMYWIISFEGLNSEIQYLKYAANLLKYDLKLGISVFGTPGLSKEDYDGYMWDPSVFSYIQNDLHGMRSPVHITQDDLHNLVSYYSLIKNIKPTQKFAENSLHLFDSLKTLPRKSDMMIIGLFSVVESLVTHRPSGTGDSLTRQISTKIPLLRKRFHRPLEYGCFFDEAKEENIWKKLYAYRSKIVHDGQADINKDL